MATYHIPENEHPLDELYVVVSKDDTGEGIVAMMTPGGGMPMVFGHKRMIEKFRPLIQNMASDTGKELFIVKYKKSEVLETINPR